MAFKNDQSNSLRNSAFARTVISLVLFSVIYLIFVIIVDGPVKYVFMNGLYGLSYSLYNLIASLGFLYFLGLIALYLAGFALLIYRGFGQAMKHFDILLSSVESIMVNKEEPVKLSKDLSQVEANLNLIRETSRRNEIAAKAAEQRKNELVVYLAHDIKTPLTAIIGYLSLLTESPEMPVETRAKYAGIALDKAYRLEELVEEFFEITRYNLQNIPIEREQFDVALFCQQVTEDLHPEAQARSLSFLVNTPESLTVFADANRLSRALNNVMKNALAYANEGSEIVVEADMCTLREDEQWLRMVVTNEGREMTPEHLERLFEKFYRGDQARSTKSGGSGLGLAIAQEIVRAHQGDITAASAKGRTSFGIWIPQ